ncbi:MAG TPA: aldehyde dehydrogenase [Gordonia sp. (in: high G+C Gram-positive bacteria)]|uniref:aldehyde dehydrogenase n=1 Tax=unclassified Gordonia (in: high G+C Gram-positive bacteria) TaxID=2657482 RepID=UPI0025B9FBB5|nr:MULTISPECIES: aldehyde dehydrogenase [unclassified Gordonia (in: high G+C Gram-positive bacteria)]HNP57192.1 aldehyde dehydrogenase [Gordonia sp. (in: high G+C Gram-positive bacteria)]HRC50180.1 aldehyde dehydrogenase [Gordonia sp. (in: high G+C Gram-positive bacteria)]
MALRPEHSSDLLIDGKLVPGSGGTFDVVNPATEEVIGQAADATSADLDAAIGAARRAFDTTDWARDHAFRAKCLRQLRDALLAHADEFKELTTAEVGAPAFLTGGPHFAGPAEDLGWFADLAESFEWTRDLGKAKPMGIPNQRELRYEAVGVVGAITPWNFPHQINFAKIGPALAAGCTVVLKPAPDTPWAAALVGKVIAEETDFPPGVVNVITSSDHAIGAQLSADPRVDIISFTGSTVTGKKVMEASVDSLKKVFLELGGKSAFIVLDDADLGGACSMAGFAVATHAGQGCAITTRLLVPREKLDEAIKATADTMKGLAADDPSKPGTICGPLISAKQRERVEGYIKLAVEEGGTIECGGGRPAGKDKGFFVEPTLISGLDNSSRVAQEEIFGPVLVIIPHDGDDDAIRIANDSPYGLSGMVYGTDEDRINHVVNSVRTGTMGVNGGIWYAADVPFGGFKQSGIGREMGVAGFEEYLESKAVAKPA